MGREDLSEPLLASGELSGRQHGEAGGSISRKFAECCRECFTAVVKALLRFCGRGESARVRHLELTEEEWELVHNLQERQQERFDAENSEHAEELLVMWDAAFPGQERPSASAKLHSPRWKELGWQQANPEADVRGAGLLGVQCLRHMASHRLATFSFLAKKVTVHYYYCYTLRSTLYTRAIALHPAQEGRGRKEPEYPFAAAAMNLAYKLFQQLGLEGEVGEPPLTEAGEAFLALARSTEAAFEEVFCASFERLDREWLASSASYMEFGSLIDRAASAAALALKRHRPPDIPSFRSLLL